MRLYIAQRTKQLILPTCRPFLQIREYFGQVLMSLRSLVLILHPTNSTNRLFNWFWRGKTQNHPRLRFSWERWSTFLNPPLIQHNTHMRRMNSTWLHLPRTPRFPCHSIHHQRICFGILLWHLHLSCLINLQECVRCPRMLERLAHLGYVLAKDRRDNCLSPPLTTRSYHNTWAWVATLQELSTHCLPIQTIHHRWIGLWMQRWHLHLSGLRYSAGRFSSLRM